MKIFFLNILFIFLVLPIKNNNLLEYYKAKHEAIAHYNNENYDEAFNILDGLYKTYGNEIAIEDYSYEIYVVSAERSNQSYSRYDAIKFLIEKSGYNLTVLKSKKRGLDKAFEKSGIKKDEYLVLKEKHRNSINKDLRALVKGIIKRDQLYRRGYKGIDKNKKLDSVDAINERALKTIFENYGYPGKKLIGNSFIDDEYLTLSAVLKHTSTSSRDNYFLPKMLYYIQHEGTCSPEIYASIVDQKRMFRGKPLLFEYSKYTDKEEINKNRYNTGLKPLE